MDEETVHCNTNLPSFRPTPSCPVCRQKYNAAEVNINTCFYTKTQHFLIELFCQFNLTFKILGKTDGYRLRRGPKFGPKLHAFTQTFFEIRAHLIFGKSGKISGKIEENLEKSGKLEIEISRIHTKNLCNK